MRRPCKRAPRPRPEPESGGTVDTPRLSDTADARQLLVEVRDLLAEVLDHLRTAHDPGELLGLRPAAEVVGVSPTTFEDLVGTGRAPAPTRILRERRWCRAELLAWCRTGCPPRSAWAEVWRHERTGGGTCAS